MENISLSKWGAVRSYRLSFPRPWDICSLCQWWNLRSRLHLVSRGFSRWLVSVQRLTLPKWQVGRLSCDGRFWGWDGNWSHGFLLTCNMGIPSAFSQPVEAYGARPPTEPLLGVAAFPRLRVYGHMVVKHGFFQSDPHKAIGSLADVKSRLHMPLTHTIPYHHPTWMNFGGYSTRRWLYIHRRHKRIWICNGLSENRERRNPLVYHHFPFWKQPFGVYIDHFRTEPYVAMLPLMLKEPFGAMDGQYPFWITM